MIDADTELLIIKLLGEGRRPEDFTALVCERTGITWGAAKEEISRVQSRNQELILNRKRRLAITIGIPTVVCGVLFMVIGIYGIVVREKGVDWHQSPGTKSFHHVGDGDCYDSRWTSRDVYGQVTAKLGSSTRKVRKPSKAGT